MKKKENTEVKDYKCVLGYAFFGGCGSNNLRRAIKRMSPADFPDVLLYGADTNVRVQKRHFANKDDADQKLWTDAKALFIHALGHELTKGRGAGADPEVGKNAALTAESMAAFEEFCGKCDQLVLVGAVGGGTGTGALPVAARKVIDLGKTAIAIVITPDTEEGKVTKATAALDEILSLVPTIVINNEYIEEYLSNLTEEEREAIGFGDAFNIVNEHSVIPIALFLREVLKVTGDQGDLDENDWITTMKKYGNYVFHGDSRGTLEQMKAKSAQEIVKELFAGKFQNPRAWERGNVADLWIHGAVGYLKALRIQKLVRQRIFETHGVKIEVHRGVAEDVTDSEVAIQMIVVAKELPGAGQTAPAAASETSDAQHPNLSLVPPIQPRKEEERPAAPVLSNLRFESDKKTVEFRVDSELAKRFKKAYFKREDASEEQLNDLLSEVEKATGCKPDMPAWFNLQEERKRAAAAAANKANDTPVVEEGRKNGTTGTATGLWSRINPFKQS